MTRPSPRLRASSVAGWTLVEAAIALALTSAVSGTLVLILKTSGGMAGQTIRGADLSLRTARILERITRETLAGSPGSFDPALDPDLPVFAADLTLLRVVATDDSGAILGSPLHIWTEYEDGETDDGTDEDGDGLVDECVVRLTIDVGAAGERTIVLAWDVAEHLEGEEPNGVDDNANGLVDERGLTFRRVDSGLQVLLTLESTTESGVLLQSTGQRTIHMRNE